MYPPLFGGVPESRSDYLKPRVLSDGDRSRAEVLLQLFQAVRVAGEAEAAATKAKGLAEAEAIRAKGEAEAAAMDKKAEALKATLGNKAKKAAPAAAAE